MTKADFKAEKKFREHINCCENCKHCKTRPMPALMTKVYSCNNPDLDEPMVVDDSDYCSAFER